MEIAPVISPSEFQQLATRVDWRSLSNKKILITGATGMVGSWLTTTLVLGIQEGLLVNTKIDAMVHSGNVTNLRALIGDKHLKLVSKHEIESAKYFEYNLIVHAASPASPQYFRKRESLRDINVNFLKNILDYSKATPQIIYFSTGEVYGSGHVKPVPETDFGNINPVLERSMYPLAKLEAEKLILERFLEGSLEFNIYRLFHTFGPGMKIGDGRSFADFIWDGALYKKPKLFSQGAQIRSFLYLEDMVAAVFGVPLDNTIYNLGSSIPVSIREFAKIVSEESGLKGELLIQTAAANYELSPNNILVPDLARIIAKGWEQKVSLRDGIKRSIAWARQ